MSAPRHAPAPPPPTLVVGMHGSGTSIVAEVLDGSGLLPGVEAGHSENRKPRGGR